MSVKTFDITPSKVWSLNFIVFNLVEKLRSENSDYPNKCAYLPLIRGFRLETSAKSL